VVFCRGDPEHRARLRASELQLAGYGKWDVADEEFRGGVGLQGGLHKERGLRRQGVHVGALLLRQQPVQRGPPDPRHVLYPPH